MKQSFESPETLLLGFYLKVSLTINLLRDSEAVRFALFALAAQSQACRNVCAGAHNLPPNGTVICAPGK